LSPDGARRGDSVQRNEVHCTWGTKTNAQQEHLRISHILALFKADTGWARNQQ